MSGNGGYWCKNCPVTFKASGGLIAHCKSTGHASGGDRGFRCQTCDRSFARQDGVNAHMEDCNHWAKTGVNKVFPCQTCDKSFASQLAADMHMNSCNHWAPGGKRSFLCNVCDKTFATQSATDMHMNSCNHWGDGASDVGGSSDPMPRLRSENHIPELPAESPCKASATPAGVKSKAAVTGSGMAISKPTVSAPGPENGVRAPETAKPQPAASAKTVVSPRLADGPLSAPKISPTSAAVEPRVTGISEPAKSNPKPATSAARPQLMTSAKAILSTEPATPDLTLRALTPNSQPIASLKAILSPSWVYGASKRSKAVSPVTAQPSPNPSASVPNSSLPDSPSASSKTRKDAQQTEDDAHLALLLGSDDMEEESITNAAPLFSENVRSHVTSEKEVKAHGPSPFSQYGLLGANISEPSPTGASRSRAVQDARVFYNITAPTSMFICGSQGSGKSHTLSTVLENCLIPCPANRLERPLQGLVFHYDTFVSDAGGQPCEAAYLSSNPAVRVRVLCAPTNVMHIKRAYSHLPNVVVEELLIDQSALNTKRMLDLMAVSSVQGGGMPLYLHVVGRILRDLRVQQQHSGAPFDYEAFKRELSRAQLTEAQSGPLNQRLETLESFMPPKMAQLGPNPKDPPARGKGTNWYAIPGQLTIVDLSCPCVTAEMACSLFTICLSLFLESHGNVGRIVALDEAHKYMGDSLESRALTESLLSTIRLQRHLGARVVISTQEPTVSPKLLDLCSATVVHRFSSPDWLNILQRHLAGISVAPLPRRDKTEGCRDGGNSATDVARNCATCPDEYVKTPEVLFSHIVALRTGEAFVFAPTAIIGADSVASTSVEAATKRDYIQLGNGVLKLRIRNRVTEDGGRSRMAA